MMSEATGSRHISSVLHERMCPQGATRGQKHKILEDEKKKNKKNSNAAMKSNNMQLFKGFMFYRNEWDTF